MAKGQAASRRFCYRVRLAVDGKRLEELPVVGTWGMLWSVLLTGGKGGDMVTRIAQDAAAWTACV